MFLYDRQDYINKMYKIIGAAMDLYNELGLSQKGIYMTF